jgi:hypothetical protein
MRQWLPLKIVLIAGLFMIFQYFVPNDTSDMVYEYAIDWIIIIGIFALILGIWSLLRVNFDKIKRRSENWQYAIITVAGLFFMIIVGFVPTGNPDSQFLANYWYTHFFDYIMVPIQATMFSLLAFFIASAAFRAFRARSLLATVLLVAAFIIMVRFVPMGPLSQPVSDLASWILKVPNLAAKRAIIIGIGLGMVATSLKVLLGIERAYLGRD